MKTGYWLIAIICLAFLLRFVGIDRLPPTPSRDEVSVAYNAWSIAETGKDEHGIPCPTSFLAFGDQKIPLYTYLVAGLIKIFGPSIFVARLPSAIFGTLTIIMVFFLLRLLIGRQSDSKWPLVGALLLAVSPWHIFYSRMVYEANVELFFLIVTLILFIYGFQKNSRWLFISLIPINLAFYTYNTAVFMIPIMILFLLVLYRRQVSIKPVVVFGLLLIFSFAAYFRIFSAGNQARSRATIFDVNRVTNQILSDRADLTPINQTVSRLFHNKATLLATQWVRNYTYTLFNPDFLYFTGDGNPWHKTFGLGHGNLYLFDLVFFIAGLFYLFKRKSHLSFLLVGLWLIAALPSSFTWDTPVTTRLELFLTLQLTITSYGLVCLFSYTKTNVSSAIKMLTVAGYIYLFGWFMVDYIYLFPKNLNSIWLDKIPELVKETEALSQAEKPDKVFVYSTDNEELSYIYFAWYTPFEPRALQTSAVWTHTIFQRVGNFQQYSFYSLPDINKDELSDSGTYFYAGPYDRRPTQGQILKIINHPKGYPLWVVSRFGKKDLL